MWQSFLGIGNSSCSSGTPTRIAKAILGVQSAGFALFYGIGKCSYSSGTPTRIAKAILGVQSAGFAHFCENFFGCDSVFKMKGYRIVI